MKLSILKNQLEEKIEFSIDSISACRRLERILKENGTYVSYTTLSRIFGIASIPAHPRESTLNELSEFLGFDDYKLFVLFHSEKDELNKLKVVSGLELQALLLKNDDIKAIDYLMNIHKEFPKVFRYHSQFVCKHIFDKPQAKAKIGLNRLLKYEEQTSEVLQHFVYEDDPFGNYSTVLEKLIKKSSKFDYLIPFHQLFDARKAILKSEKLRVNIESDKKAHYHLISRSFELELLMKCLSDKEILNRTSDVLDLLKYEVDRDCSYAYVGRWSRGLMMTHKHHLLISNLEWKKLCVNLLNYRDYNIEFQIILYSFLKMTYGIEVSLDFMFRGKWENSKLESNMLLSMAHSKSEAFQVYKQFLGYK